MLSLPFQANVRGRGPRSTVWTERWLLKAPPSARLWIKGSDSTASTALATRGSPHKFPRSLPRFFPLLAHCCGLGTTMQLAHAAGCLRKQESSLLKSPSQLSGDHRGSGAGSHSVLTAKPKYCDLELIVLLIPTWAPGGRGEKWGRGSHTLGYSPEWHRCLVTDFQPGTTIWVCTPAWWSSDCSTPPGLEVKSAFSTDAGGKK